MNYAMQYRPTGDPALAHTSATLAGLLITGAPAGLRVSASTYDQRAWSLGDARAQPNGTTTYALSISGPAVHTTVIAMLPDGELRRVEWGLAVGGTVDEIPWSTFSKWSRNEKIAMGVGGAAVAGLIAWWLWPSGGRQENPRRRRR